MNKKHIGDCPGSLGVTTGPSAPAPQQGLGAPGCFSLLVQGPLPIPVCLKSNSLHFPFS